MSLISKAARFAQSPQGRRLIDKATNYVQSPEGRRKIQQVREQVVTRGTRSRGTSRQP